MRRLQSPRHRLEDAIDNRESNVHYQPIVSPEQRKNCRCRKRQIRWQQADGTFRSPRKFFIALAEQAGLTEPLTRR
ncbi:EAL domain-containing protein [Salmonella enterica subsp. enterica]|nr:EAL domain-containing protein [Salmonella enterica subsp. enterica]